MGEQGKRQFESHIQQSLNFNVGKPNCLGMLFDQSSLNDYKPNTHQLMEVYIEIW